MAACSSMLAWRIPMDRGAWRATVQGVKMRWTQLSSEAPHSTLNVCERKAGREERGRKGNKGNERNERNSHVAGENRATRDVPQQDSAPHAHLSTLRRFETTASNIGPTPSTGLVGRVHH